MNGKDGASKIIRNLYIPPTFVQADGKTFGEMVKTQLDTYGDEWKSTKLDDGQNGLFDAKKAKEEFAKAKTALEAEGVKFPIHIDMPVDQTTPSKEFNGYNPSNNLLKKHLVKKISSSISKCFRKKTFKM